MISYFLFLFAHFPSLLVSVVSSPGYVGWLSMFQATAPVSIPVGPELAGIGSGNGIGPGTGTGNGISVSWQSPPVIFKGIPVSEALSHNPFNFILTSPLLFSWKLFSLFSFSCPCFFTLCSFYTEKCQSLFLYLKQLTTLLVSNDHYLIQFVCSVQWL